MPTNRRLSSVSLLAFLLVLPVLLFAGCDSNGGMEDDDNGNGNEHTVAAYDTTTVDGQDAIVVTDVDGGGIGYEDADGDEVTEVTWTNDYVYILDGFVFVNDGQTLNIDPGTMIKGEPGSGENASALVVARGGQIYADGNPDSDDPADADPIIFTAKADDGSGLGRDVRGEWGGVILLGDAELNSEPGVTSVEGVPGDEPRSEYGGTNNNHDVGVFRFVQIRHSGSQLEAGDEIQALTLGGVGRQSTVEYVEAYASLDDGYEWFGGTVNTKYLVAAWNADDSFDIDEGYRGNNQFWFAIQSPEAAGRIAEQDGGTDPEDGQPYATPKIYNATYIGTGPGADADGDNNDPFIISRDNNASSYFNSVFLESSRNAGLQIEDLASGEDSRTRQEEGDLMLENNVWWNIGPDYDPESTTFEDIIQLTTDDDGNPIDAAYRNELANYLRDANNRLLSESPVVSVSRDPDGGLDPRAAGEATSGAVAPDASFENGGVNGSFETVDHYGAFGDVNWAKGWTLLDQEGFFAD